MTIQSLPTYIRQTGKQLADLMNRRMPILAGAIAVKHFKQSFQDSGFLDGGLNKWTPSNRIGRDKGVAGKRKTLTSGRNHLMSSITAIPGNADVIVRNPVEYAEIHNEGGAVNIHPTVTPKMRKMAWAKYYAALGIKKGSKKKIPTTIPEDAARWRRLALTKKTKLDIKFMMPKRQFLGPSKELIENINARLDSEVQSIIKI